MNVSRLIICILALSLSANMTSQSVDIAQTAAQVWDKTFTKSDSVIHSKVTFTNRFGITLVADLYIPNNQVGKKAAIAVSGPFGAVKEQASGLKLLTTKRTIHSPNKSGNRYICNQTKLRANETSYH